MNGDWFNGGANINSSRLVPPQHVRIGNENDMIGAAGLLMPAKKGQQPPGMRYFSQAEVTGATK
jgi:hypothetical protein